MGNLCLGSESAHPTQTRRTRIKAGSAEKPVPCLVDESRKIQQTYLRQL